MDKVRVGLYGLNGHQIQASLVSHPHAELAAIAACALDRLPEPLRAAPGVSHYATLDELLADRRVELVSLCSPRRADQADDAIRSLQAGKHVYAEKPCALREDDLDRLVRAAAATGRRFHEMAGTAFEQPYLAMRQVVATGALGAVVQALVQKSYPYFDGRPQDEAVDGGLTLQVGVHAFRYVEHVAGVRIAAVDAVETRLGNPQAAAGGLRMAVSMLLTLSNGGVASAIAHYLNPKAFGSWGNETVRIFGAHGFVEAVDGGTRTRLVLADRDCGPLTVTGPGLDYFDLVVAELQGRGAMPLTLDDELHPTRMVIRAKRQADAAACRARDN